MNAFCHTETWNLVPVFLVLITSSLCQAGIKVAPSIAIDMKEAYILPANYMLKHQIANKVMFHYLSVMKW